MLQDVDDRRHDLQLVVPVVVRLQPATLAVGVVDVLLIARDSSLAEMYRMKLEMDAIA